MRAPRAPQPAPRTLATPPASAQLRLPRATHLGPRFPTLTVVLASGVALPACHDPECGSTRSDELQRHGADSLREAREGRASNALRELGVALGVVTHDRTTVPEPQVAGAAPVVQPVPPPTQVPPPEMVTGGATAVVSPTPPPPIPPSQQTSPHDPPTIRTIPTPNAPRPGARRPVAPSPPTPHASPRGGEASVGPLPTLDRPLSTTRS